MSMRMTNTLKNAPSLHTSHHNALHVRIFVRHEAYPPLQGKESDTPQISILGEGLEHHAHVRSYISIAPLEHA